MKIPTPLPRWFDAWARWRTSGHGSRPASAPKRIPAWAWDALRQWQRDHHTPPPIHAVPEVVRLAQHVIFCAEDPETMNDAAAKYAAGPTADPSYRKYLTVGLVKTWRDQGRRVHPWCDCRHAEASGKAAPGEPTGTPLSEAFAVRDKFNLDEPIGQAESWMELRHAASVNRDGSVMTEAERKAEFGEARTVRIVAGNPNAWTAEQRARVAALCAAGELAVIVECYTNVQGPWPDGFTTQGVPVASFLLGVYDGKLDAPDSPTARYISGAEYLEHTGPEFREGIGVYHAKGNRDGWAWLP